MYRDERRIIIYPSNLDNDYKIQKLFFDFMKNEHEIVKIGFNNLYDVKCDSFDVAFYKLSKINLKKFESAIIIYYKEI